jgi:hypothetical protein
MKSCWYFLIAMLFTTYVFASETPQERLLAGVELFDKGLYGPALERLASIDVRKDFDNSDDMKLALKIRAISFSETGNEEGAVESIRELYFLDPNYRFNAFDTPDPVVALAGRELKIIEEKNLKLAQLQPKVNESTPLEKPVLVTEKIIIAKPKNHITTALFPFGVNHYLLNQPMKGTIYLSIQAVSLAANIGAYWWKQSYLNSFGASRLENPGQRSAFTTAQTIQYIALGSLVTALSVSIVDALIDYVKSSAQN